MIKLVLAPAHANAPSLLAGVSNDEIEGENANWFVVEGGCSQWPD